MHQPRLTFSSLVCSILLHRQKDFLTFYSVSVVLLNVKYCLNVYTACCVSVSLKALFWFYSQKALLL